MQRTHELRAGDGENGAPPSDLSAETARPVDPPAPHAPARRNPPDPVPGSSAAVSAPLPLPEATPSPAAAATALAAAAASGAASGLAPSRSAGGGATPTAAPAAQPGDRSAGPSPAAAAGLGAAGSGGVDDGVEGSLRLLKKQGYKPDVLARCEPSPPPSPASALQGYSPT
jgi:hypothetical protein